jgi:hypothetical protein
VLYDKRWGYKSDPMTLESLVSWLEGQPADKAYDYSLRGKCLLAQYFTACGFESVLVEDKSFIRIGGVSAIPAEFDEIAVGVPHTFGAALERAALQRTEP